MATSSPKDPSKPIIGYPPATGYPLPIPHQGYPQPYKPYVHPPYYTYPNSTSESYSYDAPQKHPAYCSNNQPYIPMQPGEESGRNNFARVMFVVMTILVLASAAMSLLTWVIFGTEIPDFRVGSVNVPAFKISNSTLVAKWDVIVTVANPNKKLEIVFENVESKMVYKENVVAASSLNSFRLGALGQGILKAELETEDSKNPLAGKLGGEIVNERSRGIVGFSLRLELDSVFKSDSLWRRKKLSVYCEDLHVGFSASTGVGTLIGGPIGCLIFC